MPASRTSKSIAKDAKALAEAIEIGSAKGENKAVAKIDFADVEKSIKGVLDRAFEFVNDHLGTIDPLDVAAIGTLTFVMQPAVYAAQDFESKVEAIFESDLKRVLSLPRNLTGTPTAQEEAAYDLALIANMGNPIQYGISRIFDTAFGTNSFPALRQMLPIPTTPVEAVYYNRDDIQATIRDSRLATELRAKHQYKMIVSFAFAFLISYVIIKHGADFLKNLGGVKGIVGLLL